MKNSKGLLLQKRFKNIFYIQFQYKNKVLMMFHLHFPHMIIIFVSFRQR